MGISSLGVGSSILTQDVLDQLRAVDDAQRIRPIDLNIANEKDKKNALELIDASMKNLIDSISEIKSHGLYDEREVSTSGSAVSVSADANSDIQEFTLEVTQLATKQIEASQSFENEDVLIATAAGSFKLNIDGESFDIAYDETTTLKELKNSINDIAGEKVDATLVNLGADNMRLFISSSETGTNQDISIDDSEFGFLDAGIAGLSTSPALRAGETAVTGQTAVDAIFTFNGSASVTRTSNQVDDLITGYDITLKELGTSNVSVDQNRDGIMNRFTSFVSHYNSAIKELGEMTKPSAESDEKGIFSGESTIKSMKRVIEEMVGTIGGGVGKLSDYGFDIDVDGVMTLDKDTMNDKLDANPKNVEVFFAGGTFTNDDTSTTEVEGAFTEFAETIEGYTKYNATLDLFKDSIASTLSNLEDRKESVIKSLDSKYDIMKKQFAAYDSLINRFNSASDVFTQLANANNY